MKNKTSSASSDTKNDKKQKQILKNVEIQCDPLSQAKSTLQLLLDIHSHRNFRKTLFVLITIHLLTFFTPFTKFVLDLPTHIQIIFQETFQLWPFPTYSVTSENQVHIINLVFKGLEISVMLLYTIDLLPKIFIWKKSLAWKILNALVVTLMVVQVPLTMRQYQLHAFSTERLKIRICSIGLSFLLLCEIMSMREQKTMKSKSIQLNIIYNSDYSFYNHEKIYFFIEKHFKNGVIQLSKFLVEYFYFYLIFSQIADAYQTVLYINSCVIHKKTKIRVIQRKQNYSYLGINVKSLNWIN